MNNKDLPILSVWNGECLTTVGRLLIFLEEVNALCINLHSGGSLIAWCGKGDYPKIFDYPAFTKDVLCFKKVEQVNSYYQDNIMNFLSKYEHNHVDVPSSKEDSFLYLNRISRGNFPRMEPKPQFINEAKKIIGDKASDRKVIALHLKDHPCNILSNASFDEWDKFIDVMSEDEKYYFVAVGDEKPRIKPRNNFYWTGGGSLSTDLAIISGSHAFMGMASGLCQVAIFNDKPYAIFKHPGHHTEEMQREFCGGDTFPFCNDEQRFIIAYDTCEALLQQWRAIEPHI